MNWNLGQISTADTENSLNFWQIIFLSQESKFIFAQSLSLKKWIMLWIMLKGVLTAGHTRTTFSGECPGLLPWIQTPLSQKKKKKKKTEIVFNYTVVKEKHSKLGMQAAFQVLNVFMSFQNQRVLTISDATEGGMEASPKIRPHPSLPPK